MTNFIEYIQKLVRQAAANMGDSELPKVVVEYTSNAQFGDLTTNVAMSIASTRKLAGPKTVTNPREVAAQLVQKLQEIDQASDAVFHKIEVAGPGFINFSISEHILFNELQALSTKKTPLIQPKNTGKKAVVEYSSANIAKPFTIGHLRSTIIGDAVANLLQATGWQVFRDNHLGDWGTQFGKQIWAIKNLGSEAEIETASDPVKKLVDLYVQFHDLAEKRPEIEDEARAWFKKLEDGDPEAKRLWQKCIEWSLKEFARIYDRLGVKFTENNGQGYGESFFEDKMTPVVKELEEKKLLSESEGAKLVFFKDDKYPPMMVIKKDGATLYATRDLATDKFRLEKYGSDTVVINEVGAEQSLYFQQLFELEYQLGWYKPGQRVHVKHGMYRFKDMKMSTRKGNTIWLDDVLQQAYQRVAQKPQSGELPAESIWKIAVGAIKWNDLKRESIKEITFDWDEVLNIQGNSGPYVQYAWVRCFAVLEKAQEQGIAIADLELEQTSRNHPDTDELIFNVEEKAVLQKLIQFDQVVQRSADLLAPHHLCTYLFELAQAYNSFYNQHTILGKDGGAEAKFTPTHQHRVALTISTAQVLQQGLHLLGIETVEKM
jgi:arginyl-tRNA synthetase